MNGELKCPYCGSEVKFYGNQYSAWWECHDADCQADGPICTTEDEAIDTLRRTSVAKKEKDT